jgi:hypothetical protein
VQIATAHAVRSKGGGNDGMCHILCEYRPVVCTNLAMKCYLLYNETVDGVNPEAKSVLIADPVSRKVAICGRLPPFTRDGSG